MTAQDLLSNDEVLAHFEPWAGTVPLGYIPTFFGAQTAVPFYAHWLRRDEIAEALSGPRAVTVPVPKFDNGEVFFELANIARSILINRPSDHDRFIVVELGGGHGPRAVDCALALRQLRPHLKPFLVVVEALPIYLDWCRHHFVTNDLDSEEHWIIPAIVAAEPIPALFNFQPRGFGNQVSDRAVVETLASVITDRQAALSVLDRLSAGGVFVKDSDRSNNRWHRGRAKLVDGAPRAKSCLGDPGTWSADGGIENNTHFASTSEIGFVSALTLPTILAPLPYVDFMDVDIQFAEIDVMPPHLDLLKKKVRLLSIGTHSKEIHAALFRDFDSAGWRIINDFEPFAHHVRGNESFDSHDGVLTVQNPNVKYDRLYPLRRHNRAVVRRFTNGEFAVETEEAKWAYAASFGLDAPQSLDGAGEPRVVIDLEVQVGTFGVGCTTADYSNFVDREVFVPSGMRRKVYVPIGAAGAARHLMLRNANPEGRSVARIHNVEFRRVTAEEVQNNQI